MTQTARKANVRQSVFSMDASPRFKETDTFDIEYLRVGYFVESVYDLIDISVEGWDGLGDAMHSSHHMIASVGQSYDMRSNKFFTNIVLIGDDGAEHIVTIDLAEHEGTRIVLSRQSYSVMRNDKA